MTSRKVLIANERLLPRYGVDRILLMLAHHLQSQDVDLSLAFLRADRQLLANLGGRMLEIAVPEGLGLAETDRYVADWMIAGWRAEKPDVLVLGGWPFFEAGARADAYGVRSLFIDAGAVPHDGLSGEALAIQQELRRLRQSSLPSMHSIAPISRFIRHSQTEFDRGCCEGVVTVRLGADHLNMARSVHEAVDVAEVLALLSLSQDDESGQGQRKNSGCLETKSAPLICLLGRFEAEGYKNSPAAFTVLRGIRAFIPEARLVVLAGAAPIFIPADLSEAVLPLENPSDQALQAVMHRSTLGLSVSLWEGFNLPLVEMQSLNRPVLAFNVGAHPEVIADAWMLCEDLAEMASKAVEILQTGLPAALRDPNLFSAACAPLRWADTLERWTTLIETPFDHSAKAVAVSRRMVLIDVTNASRDRGNSGVIRVTRRLGAELERQGRQDVVFVRWEADAKAYRLLSRENEAFLGSNAGPIDWLGRAAARLNANVTLDQILVARSAGRIDAPVLLMPEVALDGTISARTQYARARGLAIAAILHDLLPIYHPEYVDQNVRDAFPDYLKALSQTDALWSVSAYSLSHFDRYLDEVGLPRPPVANVVWNAGQFSDSPRCVSPTRSADPETIEVICISTIEPRKNHATLIAAFRRVIARRPDLPVRLTLIGNRYAGAEELTSFIETAVASTEQIRWMGVLGDAEISGHYSTAAFSVFPSIVEGFGLPVLESLWMGCPCICHQAGVMAELAADGGCLTVDIRDAEALADAIERLALDQAFRKSLADEARRRPIADWSDYAEAIGAGLEGVRLRTTML